MLLPGSSSIPLLRSLLQSPFVSVWVMCWTIVLATSGACATEPVPATNSPSLSETRIDWQAVRDVSVVPAEVRLRGRDARQQLLVTATFMDGATRDATRDVTYASLDSNVVKVSAAGVVEPLASGRTEIEIRTPDRVLRAAIVVEEGDRYLPLDFASDIVPILTKGGCNGGGCHGKSDGRGGFQLSLFGFDPANDFNSIVRNSRGRRIFSGSAQDSLLLRKALGAVPHGGGTRLRREHPEYARLQRWVENGAAWREVPTPDRRLEQPAALVRIEVAPDVRVLPRNVQQQVVVTAVHADGTRCDVTRLTNFRSNNPSIATVDELGLTTTGTRLGETAVVCIYRGQVGVARILVPVAPSAAQQAAGTVPSLPGGGDFARSNLIDEHIAAKFQQLGLAPAPLVEDAGFLRRACLQITGRIPSPDEVRQFVADASPNKRAQLVDRLLDSGAYADHFTQKWADILRNKRRGQAERLPGTIGFHRWIRNVLAENVPYDQFVRSLLTASGNPQTNPAVQWYHEVRYLDRYVDDTAQVFLGVRIGCARCHNHPFEKFTQDDYYGLAAFFARVGRKGGAGVAERKANETIFVKADGGVTHPVTGRPVPPHGLDAPPLDIPPYHDPREELVDWMVRPDNPYFARAFVNRMWAHFFSRGLVEPLDDLRLTNPAANEPLLAALTASFVDSHFDMRHIVRMICTSTTYQLSSLGRPESLEDTQFHSRFYPQRLTAEVLLDAIDSATGIRTRYNGLPEGTLAIQLPDEDFSNSFLNLFGRPPRESACECEREAKPDLAQSLFVMNDAFFSDKVNSKAALAERLAKDSRGLEQKVDDLFVTILSRSPTAEDMRSALEYIRSEQDAAAGFRNLVWVLLNTKEFLYVH